MLALERLGVSIEIGSIYPPLTSMGDFFSGAIVISWRKLHIFVEEDRESLKRETVWEWFQWLAERMGEREKKSPPNPAHIAYRNWK